MIILQVQIRFAPVLVAVSGSVCLLITACQLLIWVAVRLAYSMVVIRLIDRGEEICQSYQLS
ncbi:hypothetical protein D3C71_1965870 [compost metagenome]